MDINRDNYETFFLLYLDRELNPADMEKLEGFLKQNADLKNEFTLLQQTIQFPPDIIFDNKESLLRKEEKRRVIPFFRIGVAAAVAVLVTGSLFIAMQVLKNHSGEIPVNKGATASNNAVKKEALKLNTDSESGNPVKQILTPADKNPVNQIMTDRVAENRKPESRGEREIGENKNQGKMIDQNMKQHQNSVTDPGIKTQNALTDQQNPGKQVLQTNQGPEESGMALQKSSTALELQAAERQTGRAPDQLAIPKGMPAPALVLSASDYQDQLKTEYAVLREQDFQSDNAISILALNEGNKSIAGFFKKLTKRAPGDDDSKKLRVSVFQISL